MGAPMNHPGFAHVCYPRGGVSKLGEGCDVEAKPFADGELLVTIAPF